MPPFWPIAAIPLAGFLVNGLLGRKIPRMAVAIVGAGASLLSFLWVLYVLNVLQPLDRVQIQHYFTWIQSGEFQVGFDFAIDRLTAVMLLVVTGVGTLIHIYSAAYMADDAGYARYFAYLNLFLFFMLTLVLASNFLLLFAGWEGVGLASYLLIGFWFDRKSATDAGNKAFIVNRIGDFGFSLAMFLIVVNFASLDFGVVLPAAPGKPHDLMTLIALLLLAGACGKSAQLPLYVWLPDAMEGPTPVSALIHAATMVTAGVYMIARAAPIFTAAPAAMETVAVIGTLTLAFAALIAVTQYDIKRVFAYSTVSQIGYMFLGVGTGAFSSGIYHLVTHAFFKAVLFLGAGNIIHACAGEQDMRRMGGLRRKLPITFWCLLFAGLAIGGIPPFAGYFSKDEILIAAAHYSSWMYLVALVTAGVTAFYIFRAICMTFAGEYRGEAHPHEAPIAMWLPVSILALLSLAGGWLFQVPKYLASIFDLPETQGSFGAQAAAVAVGAIGILLAYAFYAVRPEIPERIARSLSGLYSLIANKFYIDELYRTIFVRPLLAASRALLGGFDRGFLDGIVNGTGAASRNAGGVLRAIQSGNIRSYATWIVLGSVFFLVIIGIMTVGTPG